MQRQIAVGAQLDLFDAFKADGDNTGVVTWRYNKIIPHRPLRAVIGQINSGIYIAILDSGVVRDVFMPFPGVIADQVIAFPRKRVETDNLSVGRRAVQFDPQGSRLRIGALGLWIGSIRERRGRRGASRLLIDALQAQNRLRFGEKDLVTTPARQVSDVRVSLPLVKLETHRKPAIRAINLSLVQAPRSRRVWGYLFG